MGTVMNRLILILALLTVGAFSSPTDAMGQFPFPTRPDVESDDRRDREERRDRDRDRDDDPWAIGDDDDRDRGRSARGEDRGPPFCRNGEGHPVHGRQWCRDRGFEPSSVGDIIFGDSRVDRQRDRDGRYDTQHAEFHRALDEHYYELAARRPLDVGYQLELRREKQAEHDRWHRRAGVEHR